MIGTYFIFIEAIKSPLDRPFTAAGQVTVHILNSSKLFKINIIPTTQKGSFKLHGK